MASTTIKTSRDRDPGKRRGVDLDTNAGLPGMAAHLLWCGGKNEYILANGV